MRRGVALLALTLVLAGCASVAGPGERGDVLRRILPSTVQLRAEREGGGRVAASGVVVAADRGASRSWVITTRHFVERARPQEVFVSVPGRKGRLRATVVARSETTDLVLVTVDDVLRPAPMLKDAVRLGDEVWVVGFPWGRRLTVVSGVVSQIAGDEGDAALEGSPRMVDASVSYGVSGGGVFDAASGALIGIVEGYHTARVKLEATPERTLDIPVPGETTVVSAEAIRRFLVSEGFARLVR